MRRAKLGYLLARPALAELRARIDPRRYNGAMFLGLNGIAVKSHGGTDALGFAQRHRGRGGHGGRTAFERGHQAGSAELLGTSAGLAKNVGGRN